jgi:hypothetical protein
MQNRQVCGVLLVGGIMWSIGGVAACSSPAKSSGAQTTSLRSTTGATGTKTAVNSAAGEKLLRDGIAQSLITDQRGNVIGFIPKDTTRPKNFPEGDAAFEWVRYDRQGRPTEWKLVDAERSIHAAW